MDWMRKYDVTETQRLLAATQLEASRTGLLISRGLTRLLAAETKLETPTAHRFGRAIDEEDESRRGGEASRRGMAPGPGANPNPPCACTHTFTPPVASRWQPEGEEESDDMTQREWEVTRVR